MSRLGASFYIYGDETCASKQEILFPELDELVCFNPSHSGQGIVMELVELEGVLASYRCSECSRLTKYSGWR